MNVYYKPTLGILILLLLTGFSGCIQQKLNVNKAGEIDFYITPEGIREAWSNPSIPHIFTVAHRANTSNSNHIPENSLLAIETSIKHGIDIVEIDLKETADGRFVLMHDKKVDRTTNGQGRVKDMTLEELRELRLLANGEVTDQQIPTLEETLALTEDQIMINLDHVGNILGPVLEVVKEYNMLDQIIVKSNEQPDVVVRNLEAFQNDEILYMPVIPIKNYTDDELIQLISNFSKMLNITVVELVFDEVNYSRLNNQFLSQIRDLGVRLWVNSLWNGRLSGGLADDDIPPKSEEVWGELIGKGFEVIQTDQSVYLRSYITSPYYIHN